MNGNSAVEVKELRKVFRDGKRGEVWALKGISFRAQRGEIYGLLGPNGAGKTTTLRILSTILTPTTGEVWVNGFEVTAHPQDIRRSIGFLTGETGLYSRLTPEELLRYFGKLYLTDNHYLEERIQSLKEMLAMEGFWNRKCVHLSTGEHQRVNIARTIIHDPSVIILDEPTAGLDVLASRAIVEFIKNARQQGKCIILSTHDMGEAERLCDRIGIIHQGQLIAEGSRQELFNQHSASNLEEVFLKAIQHCQETY
ncbi:MAG: ABC transporter ATP-binding protein [bacterium]